MTDEERIDALRRFGYTDRQAAFLVLAALHGGFFVCRQYADFAGLASTSGPAFVEFSRRIIGQRDGRAIAASPQVRLLHLVSERLYTAIDALDSPYRRRRSAPSLRARLMGFDYVIAHRDRRYLCTDRQRAAHLAPGGSPASIAAQTRRVQTSPFLVKSPYLSECTSIAVVEDAATPMRPMTSFCYVGTSGYRDQAFRAFLSRYHPLFERLERVEVVYVAQRSTELPAAERAFDRHWSKRSKESGVRSQESGDRKLLSTEEGERNPPMLDYFRARSLYEAGSFDRLTIDDLQTLGRGREIFSNPDVESRFEQWKSACGSSASEGEREGSGGGAPRPVMMGGEEAVLDVPHPDVGGEVPPERRIPLVTFTPWLAVHRYRQFV